MVVAQSGRELAYLAPDNTGVVQVFAENVDGSDPHPLTSFAEGVEAVSVALSLRRPRCAGRRDAQPTATRRGFAALQSALSRDDEADPLGDGHRVVADPFVAASDQRDLHRDHRRALGTGEEVSRLVASSSCG